MSAPLPVLEDQALDDRRVWEAFRHHSRTFSMAARLLPRPVQLPVATLYLFCRAVDTLADERVLAVGPAQALDEVHALRDDLDATLDGRPPPAALWQWLGRVHAQYGLAPEPLYELIDGAVWDLEGRPIENRRGLLDYSNLVGGSVGAMMLPFLLNRRADLDRVEGPARALGVAMQITNIVRDVGEDYRHLGRVYLPAEWLDAHGLSPEDLGAATPPDGYAPLMEAMMETAEPLYREGLAGIGLLPVEMRVGIRAAARMYREIMNRVRARGYDNLNHRALVPFLRKCRLVVHDDYDRRKARLRHQPTGVTA